MSRSAPSPLYCVDDPGRKDKSTEGEIGPDETDDNEQVIDRQQENFKRFPSEIQYQHGLDKQASTAKQIEFDTLQDMTGNKIELDENSIRPAAQSIPMLRNQEFQMEIISWSRVPGKVAMQEAIEHAESVRGQIPKTFRLTDTQKSQIRFTAKPGLFADAERPTMSFVLAKMAIE